MRRDSLVMIALAAFVAGAAALVYAEQGGKPVGGATAAATGQPAEILYDLNALPDPIKRTLEGIIVAAESGEIENMRPVLESNELKPMVTADHVDDPIAFWRKISADGNGRAVLAAMLNVLSSGFVRAGKGLDEIYVWPYFAETGLANLTPAQEVELYRIVPPADAIPMKQSGKYSGYRLGISPSGVWHYFMK